MFLKLFFISLGLSLAACRHVPFYRKDYTYFDEFDAFYKLHSDSSGVSWATALFSCEKEGSQLFYPKAPEEWKIVKNLFEAKGFSNENVSDIYVGIHNEGIDEFMTIDGLATPSPLSNDNDIINVNISNGNLCTTMDIENGSLKVDLCEHIDVISKPYVCKKVEDITCPTIDRGYIYVKETKKCYKVNKSSQTWHDALNTCVIEGGLLANIESEVEARLLHKIMMSWDQNYHIGFRKIPPSKEYYTMKGQTVRETYDNFYDSNSDETSNCGAAFKSGETLYLRKVQCFSIEPFVCEIDISV